MRKNLKTGPTPTEIRLKADLDRARRELQKLKRSVEAGAEDATRIGESALTDEERTELDRLRGDVAEMEQLRSEPEAPGIVPAQPEEFEKLQAEVVQLRAAKQRLGRLYYTQLEENRRRSQKLHQILNNIRDINAGFDIDSMLERLAENIRQTLGFGIVLVRLRQQGERMLAAQAFAGIEPEARAQLKQQDVTVEDFLSWLRDEFKVGNSYYISHKHSFSGTLPRGHTTTLGAREEWEWHEEDVLLVPLFNRSSDLIGYFSVDDPQDRLVPSREIIELLEIYADHAVVAIENARLYQQLERHSRDLQHAGQHMQELHALKSNFVSTVSHELRTPLTAIRAYTETLLAAGDEALAPGQLQRFLSVIDEESGRLARLIESVLDLNRYDSGTAHLAREPVLFGDVLHDAASAIEPVAQNKRVRFEVVSEDADTRIEANRDQMRQLVMHLGSNAVKFTSEGGAVTLRLACDERQVTLRVEDTGIGIPQAALEKVFERFYQVDSSLARRYGGTGLGLAICKSIVDWHGGRITAESEEGRGSCFTVVLPRRPQPRVVVRPGHQLASEDLLKLAIEMVAEVMDAGVVSLLTPEPDGDLVVRAAIGLDEEVVRQARVRPGTGVAGWVAENRRPVCVSGLEPRTEVSSTRRTRYRSGTFLSVPLESEQGLMGVLNVTEPLTQKTFDAEDCHLLLHLARRVAVAWEQAVSMERSQADVDTTVDALREVLRHLEQGRRHSPDRVRLARGIARQLGLPESDTGVISFAASVHDVGMTQVGERVETAGGLTSEDRDAIHRHPEIGAAQLQPLESVGVVRDIVLSHHEWFDGTGYPRGLQGDQIPVGGRILAAVDAYESMTVGRPHKPAVSTAEALAELKRLAGKQFDPRVVEAFEHALAELDAPSETATGRRETTPTRG